MCRNRAETEGLLIGMGIIVGMMTIITIGLRFGPGGVGTMLIAVCAYSWARGMWFLAIPAGAGSAFAGYLATTEYPDHTAWIMAGFMIAACLVISLIATTFRRPAITLSC